MKKFFVTVEGDYITKPVPPLNKRTSKPYKIEAVLPSKKNALFVIVNRLLDKLLIQCHEDYSNFRTHVLTSIKDEDGLEDSNETDISIMSRKQLKQYINDNSMQISVDVFKTLPELRFAIKNYNANKEDFLKKQKTLKEDFELDKILDELNKKPKDPAPLKN